MDDHMTSPSVHKKIIKPNEATLPNPSTPSETLTSPPSKHKRASSFIKKKPRLERGLSDHSVLRLNKSANLGMTCDKTLQGPFFHKIFHNLFLIDPTSTADVSILVTDASPEIPIGPNINSNQTLIHHVIVHRESEEYQTDLDEVITEKPPSKYKNSTTTWFLFF